MSQNSESPTGKDKHQELAQRFALMRSEESARAPDFPTEAELLRRKPIALSRAANVHYASVAAVVALLAIGVGVVRYQPAEDPVAIYATIMERQPASTDHLLSVSESVLPGLSSVPGFDDINLQFEQNYHTN